MSPIDIDLGTAMADLLLLTCTLLVVWHPAVHAGPDPKRAAGSDVRVNCTCQSEECQSEECQSGECQSGECPSGVVWTWLPRYPSCVALNAFDPVIIIGPGHEKGVVKRHFEGLLEKGKPGCWILLERAQVNDSGTFSCTINNQSQQSTLDISYECSSGPPAQGMDKLGQSMKLSCCSEDRSKQKRHKRDEDSSFTWMHNGLQPNKTLIAKNLRKIIFIERLNSEHRGLWTCLGKGGQVVTEVCLEVQEDDHGATKPTTKPTSPSPGLGQPLPAMAVWGIAGVLTAILIILLMVGVYCCTRGRSQGTTEREKIIARMETLKPAGGSAGEPSDAANHGQTGPAGPPLEQSRKEEEDTGEVQYCHLDFNMEEGRAEPHRAPENTLYSEVARKY